MSETNPGSDSKSTRRLSPAVSPNVRVLSARSIVRSDANAVSPRFVLHALRQWWKVVAPLGLLLGVLGGTSGYLLFEPQYQASSWLKIKGIRPFLAFESSYDRTAADAFVKTQIETIRSPLVMGPVVAQKDFPKLPELAKVEDPIAWLGNHVDVSSVGQSELFKISLACSNPKAAAIVVNFVVDQFFRLTQQESAGQTQEVIALLNREMGDRKDEVARLREQVRELAMQAGAKDPFAVDAGKDLVPTHPLSDLDRRLTEVKVEQVVLNARIEAYQAEAKKETATMDAAAVAMIDKAVEESPEVQRLKEQIAANRAKSVETKNISAKGEKDPAYQQLLAKIVQDEATLENVRKELRPKVLDEIKLGVNNQRAQDLTQMQTELDEYGVMEKYLTDDQTQRMKGVETLNGNTIELQFKQTELARAEEVLNLISKRVLELRTEQRAPDRIKLLQVATAPSVPLEVFPYRNVTMLALVGLCLPFVLVLGREYLARRISDVDQLEGQSDLKVMAEIACFPVRTGLSRNVSGRVERGLMVFEESIDGLRTSLMLAEHLKDVKVLAVMSATTREGKTSVATQLAVSIARALGEKTLLIDGDMRSPDINKIFDVPLEPGLAGVLGDGCALEDAIVTSWSEHLHLLPAGKLRHSPHKLLCNGELKALLDGVRSSYRYIIIDTPPILAASESLVIAKAADATLMCAMRDSSRIDQVKRAYERLVASGTVPIGTVFSGVPAKQYSYRYGTYAYSSD